MQPTGSRAAQLAACGVLLLLVVGMLRSPAANAAITECDRLASHPADPDKVLPGFERKDIDLPRAEAACRAAIAEEPRSARALYQLGRVLYYQKKTADALPFLERSAALGYRQAIFVLGFVFYEGSQAPHDDCRTAELWQRSMALEHPWTGFYLVDGYLDGRFASCGLRLSDAQLARYAEIATTRIPFAASEGRLEKLTARLEARPVPRLPRLPHRSRSSIRRSTRRPSPSATVSPRTPRIRTAWRRAATSPRSTCRRRSRPVAPRSPPIRRTRG